MLPTAFHVIAAILILAAVAGAIAIRFNQPLILVFIGLGILAGPAGLGWTTGEGADEIELLARIGIALLLFVVGLKIDVHMIRVMGPVAVVGGILQIGGTVIAGYALAIAFGLERVPAFYVAAALTFSSTIIIVKLLSDKREIDALHGRLAVGILIVQDIAVILAMLALSAAGRNGGGPGLGGEIAQVAVLGAVLVGTLALLTRYALPALTHHLSHSPELLVLFGIAWAVSLAAVGDFLDLSAEVGAFLAGVSLASTPYRDIIGARLTGIRDFLLLFFFLDLGAGISLETLGTWILPALVLSAFVLVGKPLLIMVILNAWGYRKRPAFLAGSAMGQISEFSLILAALGVSIGHIGRDVLGLVTLIGIFTIAASTYVILNASRLYARISPFLGILERPGRRLHWSRLQTAEDLEVDVILFGLGRYGNRMGRGLHHRALTVLGVDFDPHAVERWRASGLPVRYGDAEDPEFLSHLPLERAGWIVSTAPSLDANLALLHALGDEGYEGRVAIRAQRAWEQPVLEEAGADVVLIPYADAAEQAVDVVTGFEAVADGRSLRLRRAESAVVQRGWSTPG